MDVRRALPFLLLVICTINAFSIHNGRGGPNNVRRVRRISEYLVPPSPPPRSHPSNRIPRLANDQSNEPGYFMRFMQMLNPFYSPPPLPSPLSLESAPLPAATYNSPSVSIYETPPPSSINGNSEYSASTNTKNCNPCNKEPWMPLKQDEPARLTYPSNGGYPPRNPEAPYDVHSAASQEIRTPDFSYAPPLPGQESIISPLPNPHLYLGVMPPLFKPENFNKPEQVAPGSTVSFPDTTGSTSNDGSTYHYYPEVVSQEPEHINPDLLPSSSQVTKGNINPILDEQGLEGTSIGSLDSVNHLPVSDGSSGKIGDTIFIEESPLIDFSDFTHKNESRTQSSSIPSTSNVFADFENVETAVASVDEIFGPRQDTSTESHSHTTDYYDILDPVPNESKITNSTPEKENIPPSDKPSHERKLSDMGESNHDTYDIAESKNRPNIVRPPKVLDDFPQPTTNRQPTTSPYVYYKTKQPTKSPVYYERKPDTKANNSINLERFQKNIDNWTIEKFSKSPNHYVTVPVPKAIPKEYFTTPKPISRVAELFKDNVGILDGFNFNDEEHKEYKERPKLVNHRMEGRQIQMIQVQNSTESSINASTTSEKDMWRAFPVGVSSVNKERVYIVTPQPQTTPRSNPENRKQKALENAGSNTEESKKASQTDTKETNKSNTFESIEKAYQVLPQAVNNLAVASTGPESGSLWNVLPEEIYRHFPGLDAHPKPPNVACCTQHLQKGHVPNDDGSSVENAQDDYLCPCR
ncbi:uncharacterized protein LOC112468728 isoform X2 [Temnothorax curvispinosus]|uniref:Uncharacterized protein LOC112468728 isoform X2 n=1 Tax=Temnothorax curvispinosus TaxID=300111 RepID=A0A6J1RMF8_9HYME|nr:uncharacterized protein LOC112468728 isoform X2 [Temnothorax curvispinosus]